MEPGQTEMDSVSDKIDKLITPREISDIVKRNSELWECQDLKKKQKEIETWTTSIKEKLNQLKGFSKPHVSIVIPAYNEEFSILQTLDSLSKQKYDKGMEVIVVANNCTDQTADISRRCGVTVIEYNLKDDSPNKKASQIAYARQKGVQHSQGDLILSTDADCLVLPGWVEKMTKPLDINNNVVCTTGDIIFSEHRNSVLLFGYDVAKKINKTKLSLNKKLSYTIARGANMAMRKVDLEEVGGYDYNVNPGEDAYIAKKLKNLGKIVYLTNRDTAIRTSPRRIIRQNIQTIRAGQKDRTKGIFLKSATESKHYR